MNKTLLCAAMGFSLALSSTNSLASYIGFGQSSNFEVLGTAWSPGANTARLSGAPDALPGGATWSIVDAGKIVDHTEDTHNSNQTTNITDLLPGENLSTIASIFDSALDTWAAASGFTNLGQVGDGGVDFGASEAAGGHLGDIRIGAILIDGTIGNVLAHAFQPGIDAFSTTLFGDIHFDNGNTWVDNALATAGEFDLYTVALHEIGHALGLDHCGETSNDCVVSNSVMEPVYRGGRRTLSSDDVAGIRALYGPPLAAVPVPAPILLFLSGLTALRLYPRKK